MSIFNESKNQSKKSPGTNRRQSNGKSIYNDILGNVPPATMNDPTKTPGREKGKESEKNKEEEKEEKGKASAKKGTPKGKRGKETKNEEEGKGKGTKKGKRNQGKEKEKEDDLPNGVNLTRRIKETITSGNKEETEKLHEQMKRRSERMKDKRKGVMIDLAANDSDEENEIIDEEDEEGEEGSEKKDEMSEEIA